jgi:hypothetical protein
MHREVPVKVNAWVDEGIVPMVEALNEFENVWTAASCENDQSAMALGAYVMFSCQCKSADAASFAADLATGLGESVPFRLEVEWRAGNRGPLLTISCPPTSVSDLASAVREWGSAYGRVGTAPRN